MASNTFRIAQKRKVRLSKHLINVWKESHLRPEGIHSIDVLRRAFSSIHTTDEIRNAVLNTIFNADFNYSIQLGVKGLRLQVMRNERGHVYLQ